MAKGKYTLAASEKVDPLLDELFSKSSGPVKAPSTTRYSGLLPLKEQKSVDQKASESSSDDEVLSELDEEHDEDEDEDEEPSNDEADESSGDENENDAESAAETSEPNKGGRKRKRKDEHDDLETKYMRKLADEDEDEAAPTGKRRKGDNRESINGVEGKDPDSDGDDETPIVHESLQQKGDDDHADIEIEKANRTLFLGNVSSEAINSSKAKKALLAHLAAPLKDLESKDDGPHKMESLRFRSTAYSGGGMPKRAAFITKSLLTATTKSTNAYVVYTTPLAARTALKSLNGTVILDRHLRADSVAHPAPIQHRRCVFVGNLGFVDDETLLTSNAETGETTTKKRNKTPMDVEEGLWQVFGKHAGKVESVRVPRDPKTRVGKGFAYVQFADGNVVEAALLLDGKKFPPMLPRALRVSRAKDPRKTALAVERSVKAKKLDLINGGATNGNKENTTSAKYKHKATPEQQSLAGRAGRLLGRAGAARQQRELKGMKPFRPSQSSEGSSRDKESNGDGVIDGIKKDIKTPEQIVFEGRRASAKDGKPKDLKFGKTKGKKRGAPKARGRGAKRAAEWRKKGGK